MDTREAKEMRFYAAMAESVIHESDDEVFSEAGSAVWAWARAEGVRQTLFEGVKAHEQKKLSDAYLEYQAAVARFQDRKNPLPATVEGRRELLNQVFVRLSQAQQTSLTLQHRGFKNMSDDDVTSCLLQLEALGALKQDDEDKSK